MAFDKDMSGNLGRVEEKKNPKGPDYKGKIIIRGKLYWLSGWIKENERGKWLSLAAEEAKAEETKPKAAPTQTGGGSLARELDDEIPFAKDTPRPKSSADEGFDDAIPF